MDQNSAQKLFEQGALFILLDFPAGSEFGIDYMSWDTGPNFKGVKMIPAGVHFIYYSSVNSDGQKGPRSGFFYDFSPQEVVVRHWDPRAEEIKSTRLSDEELSSYRDNKKNLDKFLGPYPYDKYKTWVSLTKHISAEVVGRLQPECGCIYSVSQFESQSSTTETRKAERLTATPMEGISDESSPLQASGDAPDASSHDSQTLPELLSVAGTLIKYSTIPKKKYPVGATPAEISKHSLDSYYVLDVLLSTKFEGNFELLLGEIQFAFVCFLIGQNYDSFEQWKQLVRLVCTSEEAVKKYTDSYLSFISILHFQIREIPSDFFVDIVTQNNFLTTTLYELFQNIESENVDVKLQKKSRDFRKHLTDKFNWDFTTEPDEDAPVVVDCS